MGYLTEPILINLIYADLFLANYGFKPVPNTFYGGWVF